MFINRWMDKDVVHIPHGILFNHDNLEGWDGDARGYTYGWFMLLYSRNQHNIVKQFSESESLVAQSCPTLCNPMDCSPPDSSANGILQARILEWVAIPFSRGSSWTRDQTHVSCNTGRFFTLWATREAHNLLLAALPRWGLSMEATWLLGLWELWWHQVRRDTNCLSCKSYSPIRVFS